MEEQFKGPCAQRSSGQGRASSADSCRSRCVSLPQTVVVMAPHQFGWWVLVPQFSSVRPSRGGQLRADRQSQAGSFSRAPELPLGPLQWTLLFSHCVLCCRCSRTFRRCLGWHPPERLQNRPGASWDLLLKQPSSLRPQPGCVSGCCVSAAGD